MVRFEAVSLSYQERGARGTNRDVLRDVTFDIPDGSFRWVLGAAGSGKTTLLRLIGLTLRPSHGEVVVLGVSSRVMDRRTLARSRQQVGVIRSGHGLVPHLSVYDNVALPLRIRGTAERLVRADVLEMLGWMGLGAKLVAMPNALSDCERQCAVIARAVIGRPRILLADEPTIGLDRARSERVLYLLMELRRVGSTVIIATHDIDQVDRYGGPALRLFDGSLEEVA
jgi:cell division transport system ATP-binding protein